MLGESLHKLYKTIKTDSRIESRALDLRFCKTDSLQPRRKAANHRTPQDLFVGPGRFENTRLGILYPRRSQKKITMVSHGCRLLMVLVVALVGAYASDYDGEFGASLVSALDPMFC